MPLGIDRSHILVDRVKHNERELRNKDERIKTLETENAMLYLKLAQLHGLLQNSQFEKVGLQNQYEAEKDFRKTVSEMASKFKHELEYIRGEMTGIQKIAQDMPEIMYKEVSQANMLVQHHRQACQSQNSSLATMHNEITQLQTALENITARHAKEKTRRQELHNTLMELRGNIRVHSRIRPLMEFDCVNEEPGTLGRPGTKSEVVVHLVDDENLCVRTTKHNKVFEFERVYGPVETQESVFDEVQPMLTSLLDGYNICIMAYGQTGSGKTHTMLGSHRNDDYNATKNPHRDEGVIPRASRELFRLISEKASMTYTVEVSVVEIYNNDIRDLLSSDPNCKHDISTATDNSTSLPTIVSRQVDTVYDVMCLVQHGLRTRRETATMVHEHSSRSHLVVMLTVNSQAPSFFSKPAQQNPDVTASQALRDSKGRALSMIQSQPNFSSMPFTDSQSQPSGGNSAIPVIKTKLQLVDLAGSECVGMSGVTGAALRETSHINKSLSALADVLGALAEHRSHVPYRNTRLTHLLQDSIGGDAKLLVLLCVSPAQRYITESLQCLGFGHRARQVQRGPIKRRLPSSAEKVSYDGNTQRPRSGPTSSRS